MIPKSSHVIAALVVASCQPVPAAVVVVRPVIVSRPAPARVAPPAPKPAPRVAEQPAHVPVAPVVPVMPARGNSSQTCATNDKDCKR